MRRPRFLQAGIFRRRPAFGPAAGTFFLALAFLAGGPPVRAFAAPDRVRIGLFTRAASVPLGPGRYLVQSDGGSHRLSWAQKAAVTAGAGGIQIGSRAFGRRTILEPLDPEESVVINGRPYRGRVEVLWGGAGRLTVVNVLDVDDYVQGILVHEANPDWPAEALKAQAVISRTYALRNRGRHGQDGYDLCAEPHCQVYGGRSSERDVTNRIVRETRGEAVLYQDEPITAVFHSCCGGHTEDADSVWQGGGQPYLKAVRCRWCRDAPRFFWKADVKPEDVSRRLKAAGHDVGEVRSLRILSRSRSGRAYEVRVSGSRGTVELRGNPFRNILDGRAVRSTFWTAASQSRAAWRFVGKGWGHGVGLCQWGAKGMADRGKSHKDILRFYYRNVSVKKIYG